MNFELQSLFSTQSSSKRVKALSRLRSGLRYKSLEDRRLLAADTWEVSFDNLSNSEVASDVSGDAIVANSTHGQMNIRKFSASGDELWTTSFDGFNSGLIGALEVDASGQIVVAGRFEGAIDFDPGLAQKTLATSGSNGFIASFQDNGTSISLNWAHLIGDSVNDLVFDSASNIVLVGSIGSSLEFNSTELFQNSTNNEAGSFITRLGSDGSLGWARQIESTGVFQARSIASDSNDSIYVGGRNYTDNAGAVNPQYPAVSVDGQALANGGDTDGYILKFNQASTGASFDNYFHFGEGPGGESVTDIEIGAHDDLYVVGRNVGAGDFPFAGATVTTTNAAAVIAKVSLSGGALATQWVQAVQLEPSSNGIVVPRDLEVRDGPSGEKTVYLTGTFAGTVDFDPTENETRLTSRSSLTYTYDTGYEGFLVSLNGQGDFERAWQFGYEAIDLGLGDDSIVHVAGRHFAESELVTQDVTSEKSFVVGLNTQQPTVVFTPPSEMAIGDNVTIDADAYDLNNTDISSSIVWTYGSGNVLGNGSTVTLSSLPEGTQTITATATDSAGRTGSFAFELRVTSDPIAIPDQGTLVVSKTVTAADAVVIDDVNVTLDISHDRTDNLDVFLIAPDGTRVELLTDVGGRYGPGFTGTTLDSEAADPITSGGGNFNATYRPEGDLSVLNGKNSEGTWSLEITDDRRRDTGQLNWWSLVISGSPAVPNDAPVIVSNPTTFGTQDVAYTYEVNAADPNAGDALTYSLDSAPSGMTIDSASGVISWTPNNTQVGSNNVTVRVEDQLGGADAQSFAIDVANVNDTPVAMDDGYTTDQDTPINIAAAGLLSNDTDIDGDTISVAQYSDPANGTVVVNNDGSFSYTPNPGFTGTDSFTYQISDGTAVSDMATVTFDVTAPSTDIALYVYDIRFESKRGNKDWRAVFEIRADSNENGSADLGDESVAGVAITVRFAGQEFSGITDSNGVFRTSWFRDLAKGSYYANVDSLIATGYNWDPFETFGEEDDSDGDGLPDGWLNR